MEFLNGYIRLSPSCIINQMSISGINLEWDMNDGIVMVDVSIATASSESFGIRLHILKFEGDTKPDGDMLIEKLYKEEHLEKVTTFIYDILMSGVLIETRRTLLEATEEWLIKSGEKDVLAEKVREAARL